MALRGKLHAVALSLQCRACDGACLATAGRDWVVRPNYDRTEAQVCSACW